MLVMVHRFVRSAGTATSYDVGCWPEAAFVARTNLVAIGGILLQKACLKGVLAGAGIF
jgi:hypothetical protein